MVGILFSVPVSISTIKQTTSYTVGQKRFISSVISLKSTFDKASKSLFARTDLVFRLATYVSSSCILEVISFLDNSNFFEELSYCTFVEELG